MDNDDLLELMKAPPVGYRQSQGLEPEFATAFNTWKQDPSPQNASSFVKAVRPIIDTAIKPLGDSPALRGRAKQIVISAAGSYDPQKAGLRTHLMTHLQGLKRIAAQQELPIHIPERALLQQRAVQQAVGELSDQLGREPSDSEVADFTGLSRRRLTQLRMLQRPVAESAATRTSPEGQSYDPAVESDPRAVLEDFVYSDLPPRDQLIMDYALGRNGRPQLAGREIAQTLGVSPGAISQRLAAIQERFNVVQDLELFGT